MAGTVTVACKVPNGLILRVFQMNEERELMMGGSTRDIKKAQDVGLRVQINGHIAPYGKNLVGPDGEPVSIYRGYGLTPNVDADFWDAWLEQNKESDLVKNGMIFAHSRSVDAKAHARENDRVRSGLEPIEPATPAHPVGDPRIPSRRVVRAGERQSGLGPLMQDSPGRPD